MLEYIEDFLNGDMAGMRLERLIVMATNWGFTKVVVFHHQLRPV